MFNSTMHRAIIRKFMIFYLIALGLMFALTALLFSINLKNSFSIIESVSRNAVMMNDSFALKQAVSPLVTGDMLAVSIMNSNNQEFFYHFQNAHNTNFSFSSNYDVLDNGSMLYVISIKVSFLWPTLILLALAVALLFLYIPFAKYEQKELANKSNELLAGLSKKLAHDIRTPLSTLNLISNKIPDFEIRSLQQAVVKQIDLIAEDLLKTRKNLVNQESSTQAPKNSFQDFFELIQSEFTIKSDNLSSKISFDISPELKKLEIVHAKQLYPIICNCLNNAIEAIDKVDVQIKLSATVDSNQLSVIISDNGRGIPKEILSKLGHQQITSGKNNSTISGSGIALYNAKKDITELGGTFNIESELGRYTHVHIRLPLS